MLEKNYLYNVLSDHIGGQVLIADLNRRTQRQSEKPTHFLFQKAFIVLDLVVNTKTAIYLCNKCQKDSLRERFVTPAQLANHKVKWV